MRGKNYNMDTNELLKNIKFNRLYPVEKYLITIFTNVKPYINDNYPNVTYYKLEDSNIILLENDHISNLFGVRETIWFQLGRTYNLGSNEMVTIVMKMARLYLGLEYVYPIGISSPETLDHWATLYLKPKTNE